MASRGLTTPGQALPQAHTVDEWLRQQWVCVTGGRGALGRHLIRRLLAGGARLIVALDRRPATSQDSVSKVSPVEHFTGNILDPAELDRALVDCTVVFHLAALIHVGRSQTEPLRYFEVNSLGTAHVLEACRRLGIQRVVYTSTSYVYGPPRQLPVTEDHPTMPVSVYAASKLAGEAVIQGYAANYELSCDIARLSNLYGASFGAETVIGRALRQVVSGEPIALRNLEPVRDFIHADDVVEALVRLAAAGDDRSGCRIVNVSTNQGVSVREMAQALANIAVEQGWGYPEIVQTGDSRDELVPRLILDNSRLRELTGWMPRITLQQGLRVALQELQRQRQESEQW